jgi:hypothetical protein
MNTLYTQWTISNPGKDTVGWTDPSGTLHTLDTKDPTKVYFTTRAYSYAPGGVRTFQISVRRQSQPYQGLNMGQTTKYQVNYGFTIELWVLTGPQQSVETAETSLFNMKTEVQRIIRAFSTQMGSNIQSVILGRFQADEEALEENPPKLHEVAMATAILYLVT